MIWSRLRSIVNAILSPSNLAWLEGRYILKGVRTEGRLATGLEPPAQISMDRLESDLGFGRLRSELYRGGTRWYPCVLTETLISSRLVPLKSGKDTFHTRARE